MSGSSRAPATLLLAHGSGGRLTHELVREAFLPVLGNRFLATLTDAAVLPELPPGRPALTTDAFVVDPAVFPGGDLGYLSVVGTVNDLAMVGARPLWLTWALVLEEGAPGELISTCATGAARAAAEAGIAIVAGDTKVVPRGKGDGIYATTAGLGVVPLGRDVGDHRIMPGDAVLVSGPIGDHGATIMACRHGLGSDGLRIHLDELAIPVRPEVRAVCEVLGLEVLSLACEGRVVAWVAKRDAGAALAAMRAHPGGEGAAIIGRVDERRAGEVGLVLETAAGGRRPLDLLSGSDLPRIC